MGRKKGPDFSDAINEQRRSTENAINSILAASSLVPLNYNFSELYGDVSSQLDPSTRSLNVKSTPNSKLKELYEQQLDKALKIDDEVAQKVNASLEPQRRETKKDLGNLFYSLGRAGNNSAAQNVIAKAAEQFSFQDAVRRQQLDESIRNSLLKQQEQLLNTALNPSAKLSDIGLSASGQTGAGIENLITAHTNIADVYRTGGKNLSDLLAMQAQARANSKNKGGIFGSILSAAGKIIPPIAAGMML